MAERRARNVGRAPQGSGSMNLVMYLFAALGLCLSLAWLYYVFHRFDSERLPTSLVSVRPGEPVHEATEVDLLDLVGHFRNTPVTQYNDIQLLINGCQIFPTMLQSVREARCTIHLLTYVYWTGDIAQEFANELVAARRRGLTVRVMLDAHGAAHISQKLVSRMQDEGVDLAWFHPLRWYSLHRMNRRTHRKVMVVDGSIGFFGGVGIAAEWSGNAQDENHWRDNHFKVTGPAVRHLEAAFNENWLDATDELLVPTHVVVNRDHPQPDEHLDAYLAAGENESTDARAEIDHRHTSPDQARTLLLNTSPRGILSPIALSYWCALTLATRSVDIATPYFVPHPHLTRALKDAAQRGVRVRILVPLKHNDSRLIRLATLAFIGPLAEAGVQVYEYDATMLHVKLMVIDARFSLIGSANFDHRSFELNDEVMALVDHGPLAQSLQSAFDHDLTSSTRRHGNQRWLQSRLVHLGANAMLALRSQL